VLVPGPTQWVQGGKVDLATHLRVTSFTCPKSHPAEMYSQTPQVKQLFCISLFAANVAHCDDIAQSMCHVTWCPASVLLTVCSDLRATGAVQSKKDSSEILTCHFQRLVITIPSLMAAAVRVAAAASIAAALPVRYATAWHSHGHKQIDVMAKVTQVSRHN
jgi:hypothetical protein